MTSPSPAPEDAPDRHRSPTVSIVISTLDRADHLRALLPALATLDYPAFEVVVVNGPSQDDTEALLAGLAGRIKVARCPTANLSRSRNVGIAIAAGDVVAFIDDDARPAHADWLSRLIAPLVENPAAAGVGGPVLHGDTEQWEFQGRMASDYGEFREPFEAAALGIVADAQRWIFYVPGGNSAFRRSALVAIGGFDEAIAYYLDETDVCIRLVRAGHALALAPDAAIRHYSASGTRRRSWHDRNWDVMARSDTYYCLKNGADPLPRRLKRIARLAREKWPYQAIMVYHRQGAYGRRRRLRYLARWSRGLVAGLRLGLTRRRQTPLRPDAVPPPFLPYPTSR